MLIKNLPDGAKRYPAREIIGGGFLGLVRYGIRSACDEHILKTLVVYDIVLKIDTPYGPGWHRYNHDGYGQKANGDPFDSTGVGRLWPLLTGERGHYEIAAGRPAYEYIRTMEGFASSCSLIPEQVWDTTDIPDEHMLIGRPTGSALPLVWAHAEYIKLLRSEHDAAIFDLITAVRKRYIDDCVTTDLQVWTFKQRLGEIHPGQPLRIEVYAPARLHWTANDWITAQDTELCDAGLGVYAHEFDRGQFDQAIALRFTLYWHSTKKWEGSDFSVRVDKKASGLQDGLRRKEFEPRID